MEAEGTHEHPLKLPWHSAGFPFDTVPEQPCSSQDCDFPQYPGVAADGVHSQPLKLPSHLATPLAYTPLQPLSSHDCGLPHVNTDEELLRDDDGGAVVWGGRVIGGVAVFEGGLDGIGQAGASRGMIVARA